MVEVIVESFDLEKKKGTGRTKGSGRLVILLLEAFKTSEFPKVQPGDSVWCHLDGSVGDALLPSEIYNQKSGRMDKFLADFQRHYLEQEGGPINGEILIRSDGSVRRITGVHDGWFQPCGNTFFAGRDFTAGYSGGLDHAIPVSRLKLTRDRRMATFWTWRDFIPEAHNDFSFEIEVRVWSEI